jgi:DNA-binding NarL/FixJ family response regulator
LQITVEAEDTVTRVRVLLADDHKEMRDRVVRLLERDFDVVGAVDDGATLLEAESKLLPDVCVLDISMTSVCGIDAATSLKERGSTAKIVFLTVHEDPDFVRAAMDAGALGYVLKSRMVSDLSIAIKGAMAGRQFISDLN